MYAKPEAAPQAKAPGDSTRPLSQNDRGRVSVFCLCSVLDLVACQELPLQFLQSLGTQEHKTLWPSEQRQSRYVPWLVAAKTRAPDVKARAPDTCESSPLGDAGVPEDGRAPASEVCGKDYRQPLDVCLIRNLPLRLHL